MFQTDLPLVSAPMAGGAGRPELVVAAQASGAAGFLAGGYLDGQALADQIRAVRARGGEQFGVNLFVPQPGQVDRARFAAFAEAIRPDADRLGVKLSATPVHDDDHWADKLEVLLADPVPVVSFTFGLPPAQVVEALHRVGSRVAGTITTPDEACAALDLGVDALVVQGSSAGGHSATFDPARPITDVATGTLVAQVAPITTVPLLAAGGVDGPGAVRDLLAAGAGSVVVGTMLLASDEAGTSPVHRKALADPRFDRTAITTAFTGRQARGLVNQFMGDHDAAAIIGYPEVHHLTRPLRSAALTRGDAERVHLWAGTGYRHAKAGSAGQILRELAARA